MNCSMPGFPVLSSNFYSSPIKRMYTPIWWIWPTVSFWPTLKTQYSLFCIWINCVIYAFPLYRLCSYLFPWFSSLHFLPKPCCPDNTQTHFLDSHPSFRVWLGHCLQEACWTPSCWCTCCLLYTFMFGAHSHLKTNTENSWGKGTLLFFPIWNGRAKVCVKGQSLLLEKRKLAAFWKLLQHLIREQSSLQTFSPV